MPFDHPLPPLPAQPDGVAWPTDAWPEGPPASGTDTAELSRLLDLAFRITSYNVCYTKLLRSLARSPLASVLPASPTGVVRTGEFVPELTEAGKRHAVTAPLEGRQWGGWMRYVESTAETGDTSYNFV